MYNQGAIIAPYREPRQALGERCALKIPSDFLKTVAFLCRRRVIKGEAIIEPFATAFFVLVPDRLDSGPNWTKEKAWPYVVTARHCIEEIPTENIYVRVNTTSGGFVDKLTKKDDWWRHDSADVAAIIFDISDSDRWEYRYTATTFPVFIGADYKFHPEREFYGDRVANLVAASKSKALLVGLGDDLFFPGLFAQSAGSRQNLPIARFGNISRMPNDELITLETKARGDVKIRAYLAESHSWGGHSGSPVFCITFQI
jgi:hypothetical protein